MALLTFEMHAHVFLFHPSPHQKSHSTLYADGPAPAFAIFLSCPLFRLPDLCFSLNARSRTTSSLFSPGLLLPPPRPRPLPLPPPLPRCPTPGWFVVPSAAGKITALFPENSCFSNMRSFLGWHSVHVNRNVSIHNITHISLQHDFPTLNLLIRPAWKRNTRNSEADSDA